MSREAMQELILLKKTLLTIKQFQVDDLDFNLEAALIRHFEVVGGIGKSLARLGIKCVIEDNIWKNAIRTRDKISHSYFSLDIKPLLKAIEDIDHLISSLPLIERELKKST